MWLRFKIILINLNISHNSHLNLATGPILKKQQGSGFTPLQEQGHCALNMQFVLPPSRDSRGWLMRFFKGCWRRRGLIKLHQSKNQLERKMESVGNDNWWGHISFSQCYVRFRLRFWIYVKTTRRFGCGNLDAWLIGYITFGRTLFRRTNAPIVSINT